jgi:nicotinate-nucleotide adenylyltransferase
MEFRKLKRIGLFGGSFDPIHCGHLLVAQAAMEELKLDRLFFVPAAQSPFKPDSEPASASERVRLIRLALAGCPRYEIDLTEIHRGGISYTVDTLREFAVRFPDAEIHYLIGDDHVAKLPAWKDAHKLAKQTRFAIIPRPGAEVVELPDPFHGRRLHGWPLGVSSSGIRERVKAGLTVDHLVPKAVAEAIRNNRLYL